MTLLPIFGVGSGSVSAGVNVWTTSGPLRSIGALAVDPQNPNTLYAGDAVTGGVFKSTDGAKTWTHLMEMSNDVSVLRVDPQTPDTLYIGSRYGRSVKRTKCFGFREN